MPRTGFSPRSALILFACCGAPFADAFAIVLAGGALLDLAPGARASGAIAGSYMLGSLAGAWLLGRLSDRFGRRPLFLAAPALAILASLFLALATEPAASGAALWALVAGRFLFGLFLGGDYPASQAMASELLPAALRSRGLTVLMLAWYAGALLAVAAMPLLMGCGSWLLWSLAPALVIAPFLFARAFLPESPEWLAHRTRARAEGLASARARFSREDWKRIGFVFGFWLCQIIPSTAIFFFGPAILAALQEGGGSQSGTLLLFYAVFFVGAAAALPLVPRLPRVKILVWTFALMALGLALPAVTSSVTVSAAGFALFALCYALQSVLDFVYPGELFRTGVRAGAIGLITTAVRIGSALCAWLFPAGVMALGMPAMMAGGAAVCAAGLLFSHCFGVETLKGQGEEA